MEHFINELIYHAYKDTPDFTSEHCRNLLKQKYPLANISEIYTRIIKYQIKKYGNTLCASKNKKRWSLI